MGTKQKTPRIPTAKTHTSRCRFAEKGPNLGETNFRCGVIRPLWRAAWKPSCEDEPSWKPIFGAARWWWFSWTPFFRGVVVNGWQWLNMFQKMVFVQWCLFFFEADIVEKHIILFGRCDFWSDFDLSHRTAIDGIIPRNCTLWLWPSTVYIILCIPLSHIGGSLWYQCQATARSVCSFPSLM